MMQHGSIVIEMSERDAPYAFGAARYTPVVRAGVTASVDGERVTLAGDLAEASLRRVWQLALLNERLTEQAGERREQMLKLLVA